MAWKQLKVLKVHIFGGVYVGKYLYFPYKASTLLNHFNEKATNIQKTVRRNDYTKIRTTKNQNKLKI